MRAESSPTALLLDPERAWARFTPTEDDPWDLPRAAHLHRRAGFAAPWGVLERDVHDGVDASVDRLLKGTPGAGAGEGEGPTPSTSDTLFDEMAAQLAPSASLTRLQGIWLYRMIF